MTGKKLPLLLKDAGGAKEAPPVARSPKNILDGKHYMEGRRIVYVNLYLKLNHDLQHFSPPTANL